MMTVLMKKNNKMAGGFIAALLFFTSIVFAGDPVQDLFDRYSNYTFEQLMGEYNTVIELHDNTRADIENYMKDSTLKSTIIQQDDFWCAKRQQGWENAIKTENKQELSTIIVLEYLRCGEMKEKLLEGSSQR